MRKKLSSAIFALCIALLVLLSGCTLPPIKTETQELTFVFKGDGSLYLETVNYGKLVSGDSQGDMQLYGSIEEWESDCTKQLKKGFDEYKTLIVMGGHSKDLNEEQLEQLEKFITLIEGIGSSAQCEFKANKDDNTAIYRVSYELDENLLNMIKEASEMLEQQGQTSTTALFPIITETDEGRHVEILVDTQQTYAELKKIKIKVEGEIINLSPETYSEEEGYYVFTNIEDLNGTTISFDYKASPQAPEPQKQEIEQEVSEEVQDEGTEAKGTEETQKELVDEDTTTGTAPGTVGGKEAFSLFGIKLPFSPELMLYVLVAIVALVILIIIIAFIRSKAGKEKPPAPEIFEKRPKEALITETYKERPKASVLDLRENMGEKTKAMASKEEDIVVESRRATPSKESSHGISGLSEADMRTVERAVVTLAPKKNKYKPEQLKRVMIDMGYKENVANEIIKRLYE